MIFNTIYYNWDEIELRHPIDAITTIRDHHFVFDYGPLGMHVQGDTELNCEIAFQDKLAEMYDNIALESDNSLDDAGLSIKQALLWCVNGTYSKS